MLRLEDRYVDILLKDCIANNMPTLIARAPRAIIDLNRGEDEIDADMIMGMGWNEVAHPSSKTRSGLGLIPRRLNGAGEIWKKPITRADLNKRIENIHRPYHEFITAILQKMIQKFGIAIVLDVHSMPTLVQTMPNGQIARWVIGNHYGASADSIFSDMILRKLESDGYDAALNAPYAGGYILKRHGNIGRHQHALQIEIDRHLYLDEHQREPNQRAAKIASYIKSIADMIAEYIHQSHYQEAAE